jgi:hypothetical protein
VRERLGAGARTPIEDVGELAPALVLPRELLDASERDHVVRLELEDRAVQLLRFVVLAEPLADRGDVVVQRHRLLDGAELVDGA